MRVQVPSLVST